MTADAVSLLAAEDLSAFGKDPWWLILIKAVAIVVLLVLFTLFNIWFERRVVAKMQHRIGPNVHGPFGLLQSLADGIKLSLKEGFIPKQADKLVFLLAPFLAVTMACLAFAVIPFGPEVSIFGTRTPLQVADLPVGVLFVLAVASIGIYGIVLAGWSSGSTYPLLGGLRSSAQMISYEVAMALSFVAVFLYSGSMSTSQIVESQASGGTAVIGGVTLQLPSWYAVVLLPSFLIYAISMVGETNRAPFDLPEAEGELVAGFGTEYSSMNYAAFYLAEYINMVTVSSLATTLFLGGWRAPWPLSIWEGANEGWLPLVWFFGKVICLLFVFIWLRGTLPRMRYDQFMKLGWKWLIPIALVWTLFVATARAMLNAQMQRQFFFAIAAIVVVVLLASIVYDNIAARREEKEKAAEAREGTEFDAFAGGYPVPPMPGQELPDWREPAPLATATATAKSSEGSSEPDTNSQEESRG